MAGELRTTFGTVAELYDRVRPTYPAALFDDLVALAGGGRLLEIGCGTGQATRDLVARGYDVTGIDLSAEMIALARRKAPEAEYVVGDADRWDGGPFDVVASFTAFHWLRDGFATAARLLRPGGALAVVETHHVRGADPFFVESQADYDAVVPRPENRPPPQPEDQADIAVDASFFERAERRRYSVEIEYTPDAFIEVISTYSGNLALPEGQRGELFRRLHARAAAQGTVRKPYLFALTVAYRPR